MSTWIRTSEAMTREGRSLLAFLAAIYLKLVRHTGRFTVERGDIPARFWAKGEPFIGLTWRGRNALLPGFWHNWREMRVVIGRRPNSEFVSRVVGWFGLGAILGTARDREAWQEKHTASDLDRAVLRSLREGISVAFMESRKARGLGEVGAHAVALAHAAGVPIVPVAATTRARLKLKAMGGLEIHFPFSRGAVVWGEPISVPHEADEAAQEKLREAVEAGLVQAAAEADRLVGRG